MDGEFLVVMHVDLRDPLIGFDIAEAGPTVAPHLPGEKDVLCRDRNAVAPDGIRSNRIGDGKALLAVHRRFDLCRAFLQVR